jgi:hypothetical protein
MIDGMEWLRELIRGESATSLNTGEHVTSSRGGYYSNNDTIVLLRFQAFARLNDVLRKLVALSSNHTRSHSADIAGIASLSRAS